MSTARLSDVMDDVPAAVPHPRTAEDAVQNLLHTLAVFNHPAGGGPVDPDRFVVEASRGFSPEPTGLTWRDLQLIADTFDGGNA